MNKKKWLAVFILLALILIILAYLAATSERIRLQVRSDDLTGHYVPDKASSSRIIVNEKNLAQNYQDQTREIMGRYQRLIDKNKLNLDEAMSIKNDLLNLKTPKEFKSLHFQLVLAFDKMEEYFKSQDEEKWASSQNIINEIQSQYPWLNKNYIQENNF